MKPPPKEKRAKQLGRGLALTALEARFVAAVAAGEKPTDAVRTAGYGAKDANNAAVQATRLMKRSVIRDALAGTLKTSMIQSEIDTAKVISGIGNIAFANIKGLVNDDGTIRQIKDLPDDLACSISHVRIGFDKQGNPQFEYKMEGRTKALELLAGIAKISIGGGDETARAITDLVRTAAALGAQAARGPQIIDERKGA